MYGSRPSKSLKLLSMKGNGWMAEMGQEGGPTSSPKPIPGMEGSQGVEPQERMR